MSADHADILCEIPTRSTLVPPDPTGRLIDSISIDKPGAFSLREYDKDPLDFAPDGVTFERAIAVEPDWAGLGGLPAETFVLKYFEGATVVKYSADGGPTLYRVVLPDQSAATEFTDPAVTEVNEGEWVAQHPSGRYYALTGVIEATGQKLADTDKITSAELLYASTPGHEVVFAHYHYPILEVVDLSPRAILEKAAFLAAEYELAKKLDEQAGQLLKETSLAGLDAAEIDAFSRRFSLLKMRLPDARRAIVQLVSQAGQLGYVLVPHTDFNASGVPGEKLTSLPALFHPYQSTYQWTTVERVPVGINFPEFWKPRFAEVTVTHTRTGTDYSPVDPSQDPTAGRVRDLQNGTSSATRYFNPKARKYSVFEFEDTPRGFVTREGDTLESVMKRCDTDEAFRGRCAIVLPVYDASIASRPVKLRNIIVRHPLPGILPQRQPRFFLRERLTARIAWVGSELGQLLESVGLAPGEQRKVTVTRSRESEATATRTATSLLDITETSSTDLTTELENEVRTDRNRSFSQNIRSSGRGSVGPVELTGEATTDFRYSKQEVRRDFSRTIRKVSDSVSRRQRLEVTVGSTSKFTSKEAESTEYQIKNINEGRTLNLLIYQVNNAFRAGLFVTGLSFAYETGVELVQGTGLLQLQTFASDRVGDFLDAIGPANGKARAFCHVSYQVSCVVKTGQDSLRTRVVEALFRVLGDEFEWKDTEVGESQLEDAIKKIVSSKVGTLLDDKPDTVVVPSQATYVDALLGANPATERYSEEMRAQEVRIRAAEVAAKVAGSCRTPVGDMGCWPSFAPWNLVRDNRVIHFDVKDKVVHLRLEKDLDTVAGWSLWIGRTRIGELAAGTGGANKVPLPTGALPEGVTVRLREVFLLHESGRIITT